MFLAFHMMLRAFQVLPLALEEVREGFYEARVMYLSFPPKKWIWTHQKTLKVFIIWTPLLNFSDLRPILAHCRLRVGTCGSAGKLVIIETHTAMHRDHGEGQSLHFKCVFACKFEKLAKNSLNKRFFIAKKPRFSYFGRRLSFLAPMSVAMVSIDAAHRRG